MSAPARTLRSLSIDALRDEFREAGVTWDGDNGHLVALCPCCPGQLAARAIGEGVVIECACGLPDLADKLEARKARRRASVGSDVLSEIPDNAPALKFRTPAELRAQTPAEPEWLWHELIACSAITLLAGKPKVGKSTLAWTIARVVASGAGEFLGRPAASAPVVYVSEESAPTLIHKLPRDEDRLHILTRDAAWPRPEWPALVEAAVQHAQRVEARLLVIDTGPYWMGLGAEREKDAGAAQEALEPLVAAVRAGLAVLVPTHTRKSGGDDGDAVRGSSAFAGGADVILELDRTRGENIAPRERMLSALSRYPQTPGVLVIDHDAATGGWRLVGEGTDRRDMRALGDRRALLDALPAGEPGLTRQEIEDEVGAPWQQLAPALKQLQAEAKVDRSGAGRKGDPYRYRLLVCTPVAQNPHTTAPMTSADSGVVSRSDTPESASAFCAEDAAAQNPLRVEAELERQRALVEREAA